jgi:murein DD-endopeptidase MepM/ murein hydrolase activator NlpD
MTPLRTDLTSPLLPSTPLGLDERSRLAGKSPIEVAREFESLLLGEMIGAMRKTIPDSGLLESSGANHMLDGVFDQELARSLTGRARLGIAEQIAAQIERRAGGRPAAPVTPVVGSVPEHVLPVAGRVTSGFGERRDPVGGGAEFHAGIDLAAPKGSQVRAIAAGTVSFSGNRGNAGNVVELQHGGGLVTLYAHLDRPLVAAGQKVGAGQVVATVGSTGRTTGPHLHFAVRRYGQAVDPTPLLAPSLARHQEG